MFDRKSILLEPDVNGLSTVISREYRIYFYVYTVIIDNQKLNVEMCLKTTLDIGDKCNVRFILGKEFYILPEQIKSKF